MLDGIKRLFSGAPAPAPEWEEVVPWAESRQFAFRGVPNEGFVIDGKLSTTAWRLEWGPSQRPYIQGQELRLRAELGLSSELQVVLMNRDLQEAMEKAVFEQYVQGVQTRIDNQTPPEMRWLVMYPKLHGSEMATLRDRYVALASVKKWLQHWLEGPLSQSLAALHIEPSVPLVLMIGRGRLMLRTALPEPQVQQLQTWLRLFETAIREARRVAQEVGDTATPSSMPSVWPPSVQPDEEPKK